VDVNADIQREDSQNVSLPKGSASSNHKRGDLYATSSNGARNACSARAKRDDRLRTMEFHHGDSSAPSSAIFNQDLDLPDIQNFGRIDDRICKQVITISDLAYDTILQHFDSICLQTQSHTPCFGEQSFPSLSLLNVFVKLYFKYFDPILPFIHLPSLDVNKSWALTIAIAAIGSHYFQSRELTAYSSSLHEFCRLLLQKESERSEEEEGICDLPLLQIRILNHIGFCYSQSKWPGSVVRSTWRFILSLINSETRKHLLGHSNDRAMKSDGWEKWIERESWRRLYFTARV
jgi:hypothetical protein